MYNNYNLKDEYYSNFNYNKPLYEEDANPNKLFDLYEGFIRGNMFKNLYDEYKIKPVDINAISDKEQLLLMIDSLCFAMTDISLYLINYPDDRDMLNLYNQYRKQEKAISEKYESLYGPLSLNSNSLEKYPWSWNKSPWPWEN